MKFPGFGQFHRIHMGDTLMSIFSFMRKRARSTNPLGDYSRINYDAPDMVLSGSGYRPSLVGPTLTLTMNLTGQSALHVLPRDRNSF